MSTRIWSIRGISNGRAVARRAVIVPMLVAAAGCSAGGDESEAIGVASQAVTSGHNYNLGALAHPGSCMDVASAGTADGTNIQEWTCNGTGAQSLQLQAIDSTWFKIVNTSSGKCIDAASNGTADGTNVQLWTCNGTSAQAWKFVPSGSFFTIVGQTSNKCIDVQDGSTADGTNVQLWSCNGTTKQNWNPADIGGGGGGGGGGIAGVVSESQFNAWFPGRNSFYTYAGLTSINDKYPDFANASDIAIRKREVAALLANVSIETGDLVFVVEQNTANYCHYCDTSFGIGCPAGSCTYFGRGPLQLSWNYNYKAAGDALGVDLLDNPGTVQSNASVAWQTAAWFWNTQTGAGPVVPHDAMLQSNGSSGFGFTIRAINGSLECPSEGGSNTASRDSRITRYKFFCDQLGVSYGNNTSC